MSIEIRTESRRPWFGGFQPVQKGRIKCYHEIIMEYQIYVGKQNTTI